MILWYKYYERVSARSLLSAKSDNLGCKKRELRQMPQLSFCDKIRNGSLQPSSGRNGQGS